MDNKTKEDLEKLKSALYNTACMHSSEHAKVALKELILNNNPEYFTRTGDARKNIIEMGKETVRKIATKRYINIVLNENDLMPDPLEEAIRRTYYKYQNDSKVDALGSIELIIEKSLDEDVNVFTRNGEARQNLNRHTYMNNMKLSETVANLISSTVAEYLILEKSEEIIENNGLQISNVQTYPKNIEQVRSEIISGTSMKREGTIALGTELQACSAIGNYRENQEDAVLLITHPLNPKFRMMVVADGVGGSNLGEEASSIVVSEMKNWFKTLDVSYFKHMDGLEENLSQALQIISNQINTETDGIASSTFVGAVIGEKETLISNVGDSRAYVVNDLNFQQITEDQSLVYDLYKQGKIKNVDDMRFHTNSNVINQSLGNGVVKPNFYTLKNIDYDSILLFSDGVTDLLSEDTLYAITKYTNRSQLAQTLVQEALRNNAVKPRHLSGSEYAEQIPAGKDNATAAVYTAGNQKEIGEKVLTMEDDEMEI